MKCPHCGVSIDEHEAGRDTDICVAVVVMEWEPPDGAVWGDMSFSPSTEIAPAWEVVGRAEIHTIRRVASQEDDSPSEWAAIKYLDPLTHGVAPKAPLAICRAALKAVGE